MCLGTFLKGYFTAHSLDRDTSFKREKVQFVWIHSQ